MEYFNFDYSNVKKENKDYEKFISSGYPYKNYLYDLALLQYDKEIDKKFRDKARNILYTQKVIMFVPYPIVILSLFYLKRKNYFSPNTIYDREFKTLFHFFMLVLGTRALQKGLLKYQSDDLLKEAQKIKNEKPSELNNLKFI
jgi:hypothetical protein